MHGCRGDPHCPQAQASHSRFRSWWDQLLAKGQIDVFAHVRLVLCPASCHLYFLGLSLSTWPPYQLPVTFLDSVSEGVHIVTFQPLFQVLNAAEFLVIRSPSKMVPMQLLHITSRETWTFCPLERAHCLTKVGRRIWSVWGLRACPRIEFLML